MFKVGDKVVPNGFRYKVDTHRYGTYLIMVKWEEESKVVTVESIGENNCINVTDGKYEFIYHPSELRIATEKEIETLNETKEQKFDFNNYFYVLALNDGKRFIATCRDFTDEIYGINENNSAFIDKGSIKKIIAIIPKQ
ncbi:hypothetical protein A9G11_03630 [Gilliamella sp. wkB108]|uniref:hypothetical protein n=1 Tax=Gilliamella sp. wkB108 TaxID=3120256 RepID=UPI00080E3F2A|nr:hypothetical protein [Gilliamella apicola]OCG24755.1 hypothetical protein A9G11_03630 [Gilliamella apicola]